MRAHIDDQMHSHPDAYRAGPAAMGLYMLAMSWSAAHLTEGFIPQHVPGLLFGRGQQPGRMTRRLVDTGWWTEAAGGGWWFAQWVGLHQDWTALEQRAYTERNRQRKAVQRRLRAVAEAGE